jgi:hypothetical protein
MRFTALVCSLLLAFAASASAGPKVRVVTVPGATRGLAVDSGAAFVVRRTRQSSVIRVDLATGRRTVVFRSPGILSSPAAGGGVLGFDVDLPGDPDTTQLVAVPTANPAGGAVVLRQAPRLEECPLFSFDDVTAAGELLVSSWSGTCGAANMTVTESAIGPAGERVLSTGHGTRGPLVTGVAGAWEVELVGTGAVRLVNVVTGATRTFRPTLPHARAQAYGLQPDGRFVLVETVLRGLGGDVQRIRVIAPGDPARGGRVLGTVGSPPRLDAQFCGGRLVVSQTKDRRTRILVGDREVARVSTDAEPDEACDATHLVVATRGEPSRFAVVSLKR